MYMTRPSKIKRAFTLSLLKWRAITDISLREEEVLRELYFKVQTFNFKILINPYVSVSHPLRVIAIKRDDLEGFQRLLAYFEAVVSNAPNEANAPDVLSAPAVSNAPQQAVSNEANAAAVVNAPAASTAPDVSNIFQPFDDSQYIEQDEQKVLELATSRASSIHNSTKSNTSSTALKRKPAVEESLFPKVLNQIVTNNVEKVTAPVQEPAQFITRKELHEETIENSKRILLFSK
jgi:hypothetical protein